MAEKHTCRDCKRKHEFSARKLIDAAKYRHNIKCPFCGGVCDPDKPTNEKGYKGTGSKRIK